VANNEEKHTPETVAARVVKALLKAPLGKKDDKKDRAIRRQAKKGK
jgi:hypothetical protein